MNIAVFASGSGTNFEAILRYKNGLLKPHIKLLITNNSKCGAVIIAQERGIPYAHISSAKFPLHTEDQFAVEYLNRLQEYNIHLIVLAGFMKLLPKGLIKEYRNRIVNIHPALLPKFGGTGMYGMNVHNAVIKSNENVSGITIHYVDEKYDEGEIIFQEEIVVSKDDTPESLQKKVQKLEHKYYPAVLEKIINES